MQAKHDTGPTLTPTGPALRRPRDARVLVASGDSATQAVLRAVLAACTEVDEIAAAWSLAEAIMQGGAPVVLYDARDTTSDELAEAIATLHELPGQPTVVVVSEDGDPTIVRSALDAGAVSFLVTSADARQVRNTIAAALEGRGMIDTAVVRPVLDSYAALVEDGRRRNHAVIESLAAAVEAKDAVTSRHLRAVSRLACQLAHLVDPALAESEDFHFGCLLHDIGKIGVPERILSKPGPLTAEEWAVMRRHPETGARVVRPLGLSPTVLDIVQYHHERWDGRGYPDGLAGEEIPLVARIFSVCDALEAMTAPRPYRPALPAVVAFELVLHEAGRQFDPAITAALERGVRSGAIQLGSADAIG
jgi:putative nucleotidyltransferase with HDIG domain